MTLQPAAVCCATGCADCVQKSQYSTLPRTESTDKPQHLNGALRSEETAVTIPRATAAQKMKADGTTPPHISRGSGGGTSHS